METLGYHYYVHKFNEYQ